MKVLSPGPLAEQITKYMGNISAISKAFGVTRQAVRQYCNAHPELGQLLLDTREAMIDNVESRFYADCLKENPQYQTSRIFFLKTQGKDRGYVEREEHTGKDGAPLGFDMSKLTYEQLAAIRKIIEDSPATSPESE